MPSTGSNEGGAAEGGEWAERWRERQAMVADQLAARDISDPGVLAAMAEVPRHRFVPEGGQGEAYQDKPLPLGHGQTISQPYIVALMLQWLAPAAGARVLEIGTGCGYQAAVLSRLVDEVYTIEIVAELAQRAERACADLGIRTIRFRTADGRRGWPEAAPFAGIVVAAAGGGVVDEWARELAEGGRLVVPLAGADGQWLHCFTKSGPTLRDEQLIPVRFVPLVDGGSAA